MPNRKPTKIDRKPSKETSILIRLRNQAKDRKLRPRTQDAIDWYIQAVKRLGKTNPAETIKDRAMLTRSQMIPGRIMIYKYEAITEDLDYFDRWPLIVVVDAWQSKGKSYFSGLNFHYLPIEMRYPLFIKLMEYKTNKRFDETTKLNLSYDLLKSTSSLKAFKPAYKNYRLDAVKGRFRQIEIKYAEIALAMPLARFRGASQNKVWADSVKMINEGLKS